VIQKGESDLTFLGQHLATLRNLKAKRDECEETLKVVKAFLSAKKKKYAAELNFKEIMDKCVV